MDFSFYLWYVRYVVWESFYGGKPLAGTVTHNICMAIEIGEFVCFWIRNKQKTGMYLYGEGHMQTRWAEFMKGV
jgi:uncharacterized membrane protein (DUF485 family)